MKQKKNVKNLVLTDCEKYFEPKGYTIGADQ
jgi:hypothetical protein